VLLHLCELLFVEVVRRYLHSLSRDQTGWLAGLRDPIAGHALALLHTRPADAWQRGSDRLSASYLIALAARVVREVSGLMRRAMEADKQLATLSLDTEIRFKSAADRAAFTNELTQSVLSLVARYHDTTTPGGRTHRLVMIAHPVPDVSPSKE